MTLSIAKLEQLLGTNGFLIKKKFTIDNCIVYIEVFNTNNAETFMVYIPSKYEINAEDKNSYKIKYVDIKQKNIFKNLEEHMVDENVETNYPEILVNISPEKGENDLEKILTNNYDHEVLLKDLSKNDAENFKNIYYQMSRLKLCVKNIKYKLSIVYKNYFCVIRRNNDVECFIIKEYKGHNEKNIFVTTDLENLFKKITCISEDIKMVKNDFFKILNENQLKNTKILENILTQKNSIISYSGTVYQKKEKIDNNISKLEILLERISKNESKIFQKMVTLNDTNSNTLNNDIQRSHEIHRLEKELEANNITKQEIVNDLLIFRNKRENITIEIDKILFDNNVMISIINKNFSKLIEL